MAQVLNITQGIQVHQGFGSGSAVLRLQPAFTEVVIDPRFDLPRGPPVSEFGFFE